jgi:hypothetical protein
MTRLRFPLGVVALAALALPAAAPAATRTKDISPYKTFKFQYTATHPDSRTGFSYHVALDLPADGSQPPVIQELRLTFAKGTTVNLGALPACTADDTSLAAQGPTICPTKGRIATGSAGVWTGPGPLLDLSMNVFATGARGIVATLDSGGNVLRVLRGTLSGTKLTVPVPAITVGAGMAALSQVDLAISGGSSKRPTFTTPKTCPKGGWPVTYAPLFASLGRRTLVDVTRCRG